MTRLTIPLSWRPTLWAILGGLLVVFTAISITTAIKGKASDFFCFYEAAVAAKDGQNLYAKEVRNGGYIYPPLLAMLLVPLAHLPANAAALAWKLGTIVLMVVATYLAAGETRRRLALPVEPNGGLAVAALAWILLADKIVAELQLGQCDFLLIIPFVLALRWMERKPIAAGAVLGFAFHIKYLALIFLPYLIVRGRWKMAGSMLASIGAFAVLPSLYFGWETNLAYLRSAFQGMDRMAHGATADGAASTVANIYPIQWIRSVSFPSVGARVADAMGGGAWWMPTMVAGLVLAIVCVAWSLYASRGQALLAGRVLRDDDSAPARPAVVLLEWCGLIVAALLFSPQTTARHMILLFPVFVAAAQLVLRGRAGTPRGPIAVGLLVLLLALVLPPGGGNSAALNAWRWIGGASWALTSMYLLFLASGLREARAIAGEQRLVSTKAE